VTGTLYYLILQRKNSRRKGKDGESGRCRGGGKNKHLIHSTIIREGGTSTIVNKMRF